MPEKEILQAGRPRDRLLLADLLEHNSNFTVNVLRQPRNRRKSAQSASALGALTVARTLEEIASDILLALVADARREGYTWREIGDVLHVSRQAAHQRFGDLADRKDLSGREAMELAQRALGVVDQWRTGWAGGLSADFDRSMTDAVSVHDLAQAWDQVGELMGEMVATGNPTVALRGPYLVVDVPLVFQRGNMKARVTFDRKHRICGLFILRPGVI